MQSILFSSSVAWEIPELPEMKPCLCTCCSSTVQGYPTSSSQEKYHLDLWKGVWFLEYQLAEWKREIFSGTQSVHIYYEWQTELSKHICDCEHTAENHAITSLLPCAEWRSNGPKNFSRTNSSWGNHKKECTMQRIRITKPLPHSLNIAKLSISHVCKLKIILLTFFFLCFPFPPQNEWIHVCSTNIPLWI